MVDGLGIQYASAAHDQSDAFAETQLDGGGCRCHRGARMGGGGYELGVGHRGWRPDSAEEHQRRDEGDEGDEDASVNGNWKATSVQSATRVFVGEAPERDPKIGITDGVNRAMTQTSTVPITSSAW